MGCSWAKTHNWEGRAWKCTKKREALSLFLALQSYCIFGAFANELSFFRNVFNVFFIVAGKGRREIRGLHLRIKNPHGLYGACADRADFLLYLPTG